jgi:hypothetical protein
MPDRAYRGRPYWEAEVPAESRTRRTWLTWFPEAGRLQAATVWRDDAGPHRGKTVTLAVEDLARYPDAVALLSAFLEAVRAAQASALSREG